VYAETAGNHSRKTVRKFIQEALDRNGDRRIDETEAASVGIVIYGQSFGGAAAVKLARDLKKWNVPVRLTVQVDSIGRGDAVIPSNVKRAVNLYQRDPGPVRGQSTIRAEDASKTQIVANVRHTYLFRDIDMRDYPRVTRGRMTLSHWKMDNDPTLWAEVEGFIRAEIALWQVERLTGIKR
jgi:pimeloyl-ACP methyl ester carboxylesterase